MRPSRSLAAAATALVILAGACGGDTKVGDASTLGGEEQEAGRLGEIDRTTLPPATAAPTTAAPTTAAPTTAKPAPAPSSPPATRPAGSVTIEITSQRYEPFNFAVKKGTTLKVINRDSQARTFTSDEPGLFDSGPIPPGGTFTYVADKPGKHNFHDETRPFVVGQMEVTP